MEQTSYLKIKGRLTITNSRTGAVLLEKDNLVVGTGLSLIADRLKDNVQATLGWIAIGTGASTVSSTDTALQTEIDRKAATDIDAVDNVFEIEAEWLEGEAVTTWREVGIFNAVTGGVMFNRININFIKTLGDPVTVRFSITMTNS